MQRIQFGRLLAALIALATVGACGDDRNHSTPPPAEHWQFTAMGLSGRIVYRLEEIDGEIHAATDRGFYRHLGGSDWLLLGDRAWRIMDWGSLGDGHWLLSIADGHEYEPISRYEMVESLDNGATWQSVLHDFGGDAPESEPEPIRRMAAVDGRLFAVGTMSLAESSDGGHHWSLLEGLWQGFATGMGALRPSPDGVELWYGGQGGFENPILQLYNRRTGESASFDITPLLPAPSTVKGIRFHPEQPQRLFVTGEGGIIESRDRGQSWQAFHTNPDYRFYFDLAFDKRDSRRHYTAGWSKIVDEPQPLILEVTTDDGATWHQYPHPDRRLYGGVYSLMARDEEGRTVVYLGLFKGGVIRAEQHTPF